MIRDRVRTRSPITDYRSLEVGCPIRKYTDQSLFAAPHVLSQRTTSFIASQHQGIHRIPLRHLIALIIDALVDAGAMATHDRIEIQTRLSKTRRRHRP